MTFFISVCILLTACGGRKARVAIPGPAAPSLNSSELEGLASYYAEPYHGRRTASGEIFDTYRHKTAAHRTLPFNTVVRVTNTLNGREVDVRINDRGPFVEGRVIDLSVLAAREIDMVRSGVVPVRLKVLKSAEIGAAAPPLYAVQVAAFENQDFAEKLRRELAERYSDVFVQRTSTDKTFYRVRLGRSPDIMAAAQLANRLREERFEPVIVRMD